MKRLVLVLAFAAVSFAAQAQTVVTAPCLPKENPRTCTVDCAKTGAVKGMVLALVVCNNHGRPGEKNPIYDNNGGEVMPVYESFNRAQCRAPTPGYAFGDSAYGLCVRLP